MRASSCEANKRARRTAALFLVGHEQRRFRCAWLSAVGDAAPQVSLVLFDRGGHRQIDENRNENEERAEEKWRAYKCSK